jgi:hypothetical protein
MLQARAQRIFHRYLSGNPGDCYLEKGLYEDILRRLIDGTVELGERGYSTGAIPLSYGGMHMLRRNFNAREKIGAD